VLSLICIFDVPEGYKNLLGLVQTIKELLL